MLSIKKMTPGASGGSDPSYFCDQLQKGTSWRAVRKAGSGHCTGSGLYFHFTASPSSFYPTAQSFSFHYRFLTFLVLLIRDCSRLLLFLLKPEELKVNYQPFISVTLRVFYVCIQVCLYDTPGSRMISASPFQTQK